MVYAVSVTSDIRVISHYGFSLSEFDHLVDLLRERVAKHPGGEFMVDFGGVACFYYSCYGCGAWRRGEEKADLLTMGDFDEMIARFRNCI